jgi:hypothetical protein
MNKINFVIFFNLPHHSKKAVESYHVEWNLQFVSFSKGGEKCKTKLNYFENFEVSASDGNRIKVGYIEETYRYQHLVDNS